MEISVEKYHLNHYLKLNIMKKLLFLALSITLLASACKKETLLVNETPIVTPTTTTTTNGTTTTTTTPTETVLYSGKFVTAEHTTSGTAKIVEDAAKKRFLVLENLKSDSGPDLRIYVAEGKGISNAVEITTNITIGNSKTEIPKTADLTKQKNILIWCKKFSVLFGYVELK